MNATLTHCPATDYHADRSAVTSSSLKLFDRAPSLFRYWRNGKKSTSSTPAQVRGSIVHTLCLEPGKFAESWRIIPVDAPKKPSVTQREAAKKSPATVESLRFWDAFEAELGSRTAIDPEDYCEAEIIASNCFVNEAIGPILRAKGDVECVVTWTDEMTGIVCKARMDKLLQVVNGPLIFDLKTCADASFSGFQKAAIGYGYHIQAAHYIAAAEALTGQPAQFFFGCVETSDPYLTHCFRASDDFIRYGQSERRRLLDALAKCFDGMGFPGLCQTESGYSDLTLPAWVKA